MAQIDIDLLRRHWDVLHPSIRLANRLWIGRKQNWACGPCCEVLFDLRKNVRNTKVSHNRNHSIVWREEAIVKIQQIRARETLDGFGITMTRTVQRMRAINQFIELPSRDYLGSVFRTRNLG